jgi:hypothetical protein
MLTTSILLAIQALTAAPSDSAFLSGDTLRIEPLGLRLIIPAFWMGRIPPGATPSAPGAGRFGCQLMQRSAVEERIITDREKLTALQRALSEPRQTYEAALDSIAPRTALVAHLSAVPYASSCLAPHVLVYVVDKSLARPSAFAGVASREVVRQYSGIKNASADSAGWSMVRLSWTESKTDFIRPATLEIWCRQLGDRLVILGIMEGWSGKGDMASLLSSIR